MQSRFSLEDAAQLLQSTAQPLLQPQDHQDISTSATFDLHHGSNGSTLRHKAAQNGTKGAASHQISAYEGAYGFGASSNGHVSHQNASANGVNGQNGHASSNGSHSTNGNGSNGHVSRSNGNGSQAFSAEVEELPIQVATLLFFLQQFCLQLRVC